MGLFDKVFGGASNKEVTLTTREAFAGILLLTIAGDGYVSDEEKEEFIAALARMQLFKTQSPTEFDAMIDKLFGLVHKQGPNFLLEKSASSMTEELRETAFAVATDLAFSDGSVEGKEKWFIEKLGRVLEIEDGLAMRIIEVLAIKNRG